MFQYACMVDGGHVEAGGGVDPAAREALGDVAARSYMVVDITGLGPGAVDGLRRELGDWGAAAVVIPERWARIVGRFATGEIEHGSVLATRDDLLHFIDPERSKPAHATSTRIWNALGGAHSWAVRAPQQALASPASDDVLAVERELLQQLFVRLPDEESQRLDVGILRELLTPDPATGKCMALDLRNISTYSVNLLSGFVNQRLGLSGDDALPVRENWRESN